MFSKQIKFHFVRIITLLGVLVIASANPISAGTPLGTPSATLPASPLSATSTLTATVTSTATRSVVTATAASPISTRAATLAPTVIPPTATRVPPTATRTPPTPTRANVQSPVVRPQSGRALAGPAGTALVFNGSNQYVTFGPAADLAQLGVQTFTIETWFKKTGAGATTSTGNGGITAVPLVTKGRGEAENSSVDMNYFLGIDSTGVLAADFEECALAMGAPCTAAGNGGQNYPAKASTVIQNNIWYHAAVTYDGRYWRFYLNGVQDGATTDLGATRYPRWDSIQHAGIGTAMTSTGVAGGYFQGVMDEIRIWNVVRSQSEIQADMYNELTIGTGLIGRWGLNEGTGSAAGNSIAGRPKGTLINSPTWVAGFPIPDTTPPAAPTGLAAAPYSSATALTWTANSEPDMAGYYLYRATTTGGPYIKVNASLITTTSYNDGGLTNGTTYYYVLRAVDTSTNESGNSSQVSATPQLSLGAALQFDGVNDYVTFGPAPELGAQTFTIETWFKRTGTGVAVSTGTNGVMAVPLVTKGSPEADGSNVDENYILGIRSPDNVLAGDFETFAVCLGRPAGDNNPIVGVTPIVNNTWYHAAFTYDGAALRLYLNGNLENTLASTCIPRYDSIQHAGLGTYLTSTGAASGFFAGVLDEVRIWKVALTQVEIQSTMNSELTSGKGLIGRWGMNEGTGTTITSSIGTPTGTLTNGPVWVPGAPFAINQAPGVPTGNNPSNGATGVPTLTPLTVTVADPESNPMTVRFYGRLKTISPQFSLVLLPDTQYYTTVGNQPTGATIFNGQTNWIVNNKAARNIAFVNNLGDTTDQLDASSYDSEWTIADAAFDILDAGNVPYNVVPGNHDLMTGASRFETWFGVSRFSGKSYYGGHYGTDNTNNYNLFSASGLDFILINLSCPAAAPPAAVLDWANTLLAANSNRRGIAVCHDLLAGGATPAFSAAGQAVYTALKGNPNLFLLLGGHLDQAGSRTDIFNGNTVYSMRSDYQYEPNGGNGWLRILEFQPANNQIQVWTYSPYLSQSFTDATNQFTVTYNMSGPWQSIGTVNAVASGSTASVNWTGLGFSTQYEWYATANDGLSTTASPTWSFTTENNPTAVTLSSFTVLAVGSANNWLTTFGLVLGIFATAFGGMWLIRDR